jgi:ElaB/YqjD/DUF883 family membrane-anchored ribosome-binding protein
MLYFWHRTRAKSSFPGLLPTPVDAFSEFSEKTLKESTMAKSQSHTGSISEAIEKLEAAGRTKSEDLRGLVEKDYEELKNAIEDLKPHLDELRNRVEDQVKTEYKERKHQVEAKVKENPWLALGLIGIIAFVIGLLLGQSRRD